MFIGVPEKGRNAGIALREELPEDYETEFLLDVLNGAGKLYAKTGLNRRWIDRAVGKLEPVELKDTGRNFWRPVFTEAQLEDREIESYQENPFDSGADRFYQGFDQLIEQNYSVEEISGDFEDLVEEVARENGYELAESYGYNDEDEGVKWGLMNTDLEVEPETVLLPEEFQTVGEAAAEDYWNTDFEYRLFEEYAEERNLGSTDEEKVLAQTPPEVAGAYMFVSGETAEDAGLEYERIPGFTSRLGKFQNQYKNSVKNRF